MCTLSQNQSLRLLFASVLCFLFIAPGMACTRVVHRGPAGPVVTGRTMDWTQSMETNLWAFPAGLSHNGNAGPQSIEWTSKYGSVVATCYNGLSADGLNEKGLVANILYLSSSVYPKLDGKQPALSIAGWSQYVLDNFATVAEAVAALKDEPFQLAGEASRRFSPVKAFEFLPGGDKKVQ